MAQRITLLGCIDCVISGNTHDLTLISCTGITGAVSMSGRTYIEGGRVLSNQWGELNYLTASALQPKTLGGVGQINRYKIDTSGGDVYLLFDLEALNGVDITLKVIDATNNIIINTVEGTGQFEQTALPYTLTPVLLDSYTISSDGTDLYII